MKLLRILLFSSVAIFAQSAQAPAGIPAGAVAIEGNTWRWVDKDGKAWLYRVSPFGLLRSEEPKQVAAKRPAGVPAAATSVSDGVWRWVDPQGKVWLFQETPTGLMKSEEPKGANATLGPTGRPTANPRPDAIADLISVKEEGESLRFTRPGPFGQYSWVKKKTELDQDETIAWQRARAKAGAAKAK